MDKIRLYSGGFGHGKTLMSIKSAVDFIKENPEYVLVSNIELSGIDYIPFDIGSLDTYRSSIIILDDLWIYADSRRYNSRINCLMSYFFTKIQEHDVYVIANATGGLRMIDIRIRKMIMKELFCFIDDDKENLYVLDIGHPDEWHRDKIETLQNIEIFRMSDLSEYFKHHRWISI